jgi:hypothetical protein
VPDELVPGCVDDRHLAVEDRYERIGGVTDLVQQLPYGRRARLADLGENRELRRGQRWAGGCGHPDHALSHAQSATTRNGSFVRRFHSPPRKCFAYGVPANFSWSRREKWITVLIGL